MTGSAASIRDRLRNLVREDPQAFQSLLIRYGVERLLFRVSASVHASRFVLKGAQVLLVYQGAPHRPTKDLDLLALGDDDVDDLASVFRDVCNTPVESDGLTFHPTSVNAEKLESLTLLGLATSRMKDLYDLWHVLRTFDVPADQVRS